MSDGEGPEDPAKEEPAEMTARTFQARQVDCGGFVMQIAYGPEGFPMDQTNGLAKETIHTTIEGLVTHLVREFSSGETLQ